jgi:hypothetical protein
MIGMIRSLAIAWLPATPTVPRRTRGPSLTAMTGCTTPSPTSLTADVISAVAKPCVL